MSKKLIKDFTEDELCRTVAGVVEKKMCASENKVAKRIIDYFEKKYYSK